MLKTLLVIFKGFFIGGTMTVPGVSGGSMAMILGVYDQLIHAVASFTKNPKKNALFLIEFGVGGLLGITIVAHFVIAPLLAICKTPVSYFFLGAVVGGIPVIFKTAGIKKFNFNVVTWPIVGIIVVLLVSAIPEGLFQPTATITLTNVLLQLLGGLLISVAFILPGISFSQMLLMLGLYEPLVSAKSINDLLLFIPLGIGAVVGSILCAKAMQKAMEKHPQPTYLTIFGFLLGSLPKLFPGIPVGFDIPASIVALGLGFCLIFFLQMLESKKTGIKG